MIVDIFIPCFMDQIYPGTALNMVKILEHVGCKVNYNVEQTCCGQPAFNAGYWDHCKEVGEKFIKEFPEDRYIITPSASCAGMVKNYYGEMFHNSSLHNEYKQVKKNLFEFSDFLVNILKITDLGAKLDGIATYHDSCAALREYGIKREPRVLLEKVKGLELIEMHDVETCCGFGGTFAAKFESISIGMAQQKVDNAVATGAKYIVSTDMSCLMHLDTYLQKENHQIKIMHLVDVLASGIE
ncbi:MAG: (Fe-S)-binding protein [Bacteroidetes bacterium]|nr:(Fe-S)-binding protein [Bacteroidota bacterium]HET6245025.1 (Fe-S)-binding protein [Bacteroidia bacterium]